jgi:hypothetical protein
MRNEARIAYACLNVVSHGRAALLRGRISSARRGIYNLRSRIGLHFGKTNWQKDARKPEHFNEAGSTIGCATVKIILKSGSTSMKIQYGPDWRRDQKIGCIREESMKFHGMSR